MCNKNMLSTIMNFLCPRASSNEIDPNENDINEYIFSRLPKRQQMNTHCEPIVLDGLTDKERRAKFIDACKSIGIDTNIGQSEKNIDDTPFLNLMVKIPNRSSKISFIFSLHALGFGLIETMTSILDDEKKYLNEHMGQFYDDVVQKWDNLDDAIRFVTLLKEFNNPINNNNV